jgi:RNA polymerase subunit RPABC4/transcription elongation factor Spt4
MGIFSDRCMKEGCSGRVPKSAKFCRVCGTPASNADTNCGRCGAVVATSSKFCWSCGGDLAEMQKPRLFGSRWVREADDFAVRIDEWDVKGVLIKGLNVEHGTTGMVFQRGRYCGCVDDGQYDMNGFLKKVNHFNQTTPTAVVVVDAGDVPLHLEAIKLRSREQVEVDAIFKAVVRMRDPEKFFTNAFKARNQLTVGYLAGSLMDELRMALQTYVGARPVQELYSNTGLRKDVERQMQLELEPILERIGLEMVQLRFVDFFCPTYDPIRQKEAELYVDTRAADVQIDRLKLTQRLRKSLTEDKMDELKTEKDFEDFVRQTEHELGLKNLIREDEMERLKRRFLHERNREVLLQEIEIAGIRNDAVRGEARKELQAKLERFALEKDVGRDDRIKDAGTDRGIRADDHTQDMQEAHDAVGLRREVEDVEFTKRQREQGLDLQRQQEEQKVEAERLRERSKSSAQALLSILDGPAADRILRLEEFRAKEKLTPDQLVAMAAADSPHIAHVLAEKYKAEATMSDARFKQLQEFMARQETVSRESADRLERVMNVSLSQMGMTATTRAQAPYSSQTVVTPGGGIGSPPIVINPQVPAEQKACPKCHQMIPLDSRFCQHCREKL